MELAPVIMQIYLGFAWSSLHPSLLIKDTFSLSEWMEMTSTTFFPSSFFKFMVNGS